MFKYDQKNKVDLPGVVGNYQSFIQVDESLFGAPHKDTKMAEMREQRQMESNIETQARERSANRNNRKKPGKKEVIQVVTKDLIRNLM